MMAANPSPNPRAARAAYRLKTSDRPPPPRRARMPALPPNCDNGIIDQSDGVTVKSSKYTWLSALDHRPTRPETGWGRTCSRESLPSREPGYLVPLMEDLR